MNTSDKTSVLLADDHPGFLAGLTQYFKRDQILKKLPKPATGRPALINSYSTNLIGP